MNTKWKKRLAAVACLIILGLLAFFAADVPFFIFQDENFETGSAAFSVQWFQAVMPFTLIIVLSLACIVLDVLLRKRLYRKSGFPEGRIKATHADRPHFRFGFETIRWSIMILSFILLIWGGQLLGTTLSQVQLPVLACPYNLDQGTGAGCFLFSHLDVLLESTADEILWFIGSFLVCAVVFGRLLCGFVCPLGFLQDVMHQLRQSMHVEGVSLSEIGRAHV